MSQNDTSLRHQSGEEPERLYIAAGNIWGIMLAITIVACVLAVAAGAYMLLITFWDMNPNNSQGGGPQNLNRTELVRVVGDLSSRGQYFLGLQTSSSTVADPSK